jgi:hypothetical protein
MEDFRGRIEERYKIWTIPIYCTIRVQILKWQIKPLINMVLQENGAEGGSCLNLQHPCGTSVIAEK